MKLKQSALLVLCLLLGGRIAWAHRIDEYLQATILSLAPSHVDAAMRLIPGVLVASSVIGTIDSNHDGFLSKEEKHAYAARILSDLAITLNGQPVTPELDSWSVPDAGQLRDGLSEIHVQYHMAVPSTAGPERRLVIANRHMSALSVYLVNVEVSQNLTMRIVDQNRNTKQSMYELVFEQGSDALEIGRFSAVVAWWQRAQMASLFWLGMRHIAEGTDHLLFLLVLLLPAPLLTSRSRWASPASVRHSLLHILGIVTAFTVGHSLMLTLAAMNIVRVPSRPVEVLIAVSILVSAVHALRPIFPGREAWIAASFGLIHGLAFASTLERLGLSHWDRLLGILSFNLGIEVMQLCVVAMVLPSLLILSRTRAYLVLRVTGAVIAILASLIWTAERLKSLDTSVDTIIDAIARRGTLLAAALFLLSLLCFRLYRVEPVNE